MGLAIGIGIYALLRRRGLPWWGASIPALPVLFDVWELQLEHMIAADTLFTLLIMAALILACWWDRPPLVGLDRRRPAHRLLRDRPVGRRADDRHPGGRPARCAGSAGGGSPPATVAGLVPIAGLHGAGSTPTTAGTQLTQSSGTFLYSRVSSFADCQKMNPAPDLRVLCDSRPPAAARSSQEYLWANDTPLGKLTGTNNIYRFTPQIKSLTRQFAKRAILSQPLDYVAVVADDTLAHLRLDPVQVLTWPGRGISSASSPRCCRFRPGSPATSSTARAASDYGGATYGRPAVVQPWARFLWHYEQVRLPARVAARCVLLLTGAVGVVLARRKRARIRAASAGAGAAWACCPGWRASR